MKQLQERHRPRTTDEESGIIRHNKGTAHAKELVRQLLTSLEPPGPVAAIEINAHGQHFKIDAVDKKGQLVDSAHIKVTKRDVSLECGGALDHPIRNGLRQLLRPNTR